MRASNKRLLTLDNPRCITMAAAALVLIAASLWHVHVIDRDMPSSHSDLLPRWVGARAALQGRDPYSRGVLKEIQTAYYGRPLTDSDHRRPQTFLYPAHIVILLAPLTPLRWETARLLFLAFATPLFAWSLWTFVRGLNLSASRDRTAALVFLSLCSWPVMWGLRLQQPTLFVAALIFLACSLLRRARGFAAGILFAIATVKPQLVALLLVWLLLWACIHRMWSFLISFATTLALAGIWTERIVPGWFGRWSTSLDGYTQATHTAMPLETVFGHVLGLTFTVLAVGWSCLILWRLRRCAATSSDFGLAISLALAATIALVPADMPMIYNQVVLIPGCLILFDSFPTDYYAAVARRLSIRLIWLSFILVPLAVTGETLGHPSGFWDSVPFRSIFLPPAILIALAALAKNDTLHTVVPQAMN